MLLAGIRRPKIGLRQLDDLSIQLATQAKQPGPGIGLSDILPKENYAQADCSTSTQRRVQYG